MYKLPIDKSEKMWYNWPGAHGQGARNFHYIILLAICQAKSRKKLHKYFIPILCNIPSCNLLRGVVLYWCQGERPGRATARWVSRRLRRNSSRVFPLKKKCKKPLDKSHTMWYNKGVKRGTSAAKAPSTVDNRNRSGLITNSH